GGGDPLEQQAARAAAGHDRGHTRLARAQGVLAPVEAQASLAATGVRPVTGVAVIREDGPDVAVEVDLARRAGERGRGQHKADGRRPQLRMKYHTTPSMPMTSSPRVATRGLFFSPRPLGERGWG